MKSVFQKLVAGGPGRTTRLHTEDGRFIPIRELRHIPRCLLKYMLVRVSRNRPHEPWWPMAVIPVVAAHLAARQADVIEFGSGGSTVWLAKRARKVLTIEDNPQWYKVVIFRLQNDGLKNTTIKLAHGHNYYDLTDVQDR